MHRAFAPELNEAASAIELRGDEARHLLVVCRAKPGDAVELFDGAGLSATGRIAAIAKGACAISIESMRREAGPPDGIVLITALPKADRTDFLVEKATELGVGKLIPLECDRSVVRTDGKKLEKLRRASVEACKQCGRNWRMPILPAISMAQLGAQVEPPGVLFDAAGVIWSGRSAPEFQTAVIGPEGGWTPRELETAAGLGLEIVRLPGHVLRIETAALAAASRRLWRD